MVELLFVTCMAGGPATSEHCRERSLVFTEATPTTCMMHAQPHLAEWVVNHAGHRIQSWTCQVVVPGEREA
ncbi:hypothetical protein [Citreimonas salinaria]|uniref:Uncharacterized protein n=1 Tax=Citreimonas salinaria TaxID=321339 RepID=A0A1H3FJN9_9RHOB|nr:hypothetical protein [Citreimonas salinaria]SDX90598.1 hypothetical protein SAMN05444340_101453 [Citreimonas salinaria]